MLWIVVTVGAGLIALERLRPGWELPRLSSWLPRALSANLAQIGIVLVVRLTWERWLRTYRFFALGDHLGTYVGGVIGYLVSTFVYYWWHRLRHTARPLWLAFTRCTIARSGLRLSPHSTSTLRSRQRTRF